MLGILAQNDQNVVNDPADVKWLVGEHDLIELDVIEWHDYTIIAKDNHLVKSVCDNTLECLIRQNIETVRQRRPISSTPKGPSKRGKYFHFSVLAENGCSSMLCRAALFNAAAYDNTIPSSSL